HPAQRAARTDEYAQRASIRPKHKAESHNMAHRAMAVYATRNSQRPHHQHLTTLRNARGTSAQRAKDREKLLPTSL
ncbi:hypothetical protein A2U01_0057423, partial [Trifolium medium]|nr:hypothetical protein [Trifolium medium]